MSHLPMRDFDRYFGMDEDERDDTSPLDEGDDIDLELLAYWADHSELFAPPRNDYQGD